MTSDPVYDPMSHCWIIAIPALEVRGWLPNQHKVSRDDFERALDKLDRFANRRQRAMRHQIAINTKRRWRHKQPRRVLA